jgi:hypothetical protein
MGIISPISRVESRIAEITSRFAPSGSTSGIGASSGGGAIGGDVIDQFDPGTQPEGFDPFGTVYQQALASAGATSRSASFGSSFSSGSTSSGYDASISGVGSGPVTVPASSFVLKASPGASIGKVGGYGPMPIPEDLAVSGNGQLPATALESIGQDGHRLWGPAATAWKQAVAAAANDGIDLKVTDSYRSYDEQVDLVKRKGLYSEGGYAAVPGTSNHGWGLAVDVDTTNPAAMSWMRANGYRFGFVEAVPREPWHWEFRPQQA